MPKPRQPTDLVLLKGKKHLTKKEIAERQASEVKALSDNISPPDYMPEELKKEFNKIANELIRIDIMSNLDIDALARFIIARKLYVEYSKKLLNKPKSSEIADLLNIQDKLFKQCRQSASDLGLTISSRCKLVVPKKPKEEPKNKFQKFM